MTEINERMKDCCRQKKVILGNRLCVDGNYTASAQR